MMEGAAECTPIPADAFASILGSWTMTSNDTKEEAKVTIANDGYFSLTDGEDVMMTGILRPAAGQEAKQGWHFVLMEKNGTDADTLATFRISDGKLDMEWRTGNQQIVGKGTFIVPPPEESESESSSPMAMIIGIGVGACCLAAILGVVCLKYSILRRNSSPSESTAANPRLLGSVKAASKDQLHGVVASQSTNQYDNTLEDNTLELDMEQVMLELDMEQGEANPIFLEPVKAASKDQLHGAVATQSTSQCDNTLEFDMGQDISKLDLEQGEAGSTTCGDIDQGEAGPIEYRDIERGDEASAELKEMEHENVKCTECGI